MLQMLGQTELACSNRKQHSFPGLLLSMSQQQHACNYTEFEQSTIMPCCQ